MTARGPGDGPRSPRRDRDGRGPDGGGPGGVGRGPGRGGSAPAVEVEDLTFAYPDGRPVLHGVNLRIGPGERVAVLGPNGAGKTTLVLHLNGIHVPARGRVTVGGVTLDRRTVRELRRRVGVVFQDPDDQLFMPTVRQDVAFGPANLGLRGPELAARVDRALAAVGMDDVADRAPHHLSFGQRRRVAVATVLAMEPDVLVLDEPSSNLDPAGRRELAGILVGLEQTVVMVTHDLPYALELCPRSLVMDGGTIVADGETAAIMADEELMEASRLALPYGFDPRAASGHVRSRPAANARDQKL